MQKKFLVLFLSLMLFMSGNVIAAEYVAEYVLFNRLPQTLALQMSYQILGYNPSLRCPQAGEPIIIPNNIQPGHALRVKVTLHNHCGIVIVGKQGVSGNRRVNFGFECGAGAYEGFPQAVLLFEPLPNNGIKCAGAGKQK
jgi:hypothetical protein